MASYLLFDGRRVKVLDLLQAELLSSGQQLTFSRPRFDAVFTAIVTADGRLELEGGRTEATPSGAAGAAVGGGNFDGWEVWFTADNKSLADLRLQFLAGVEASEDTAGVSVEAPTGEQPATEAQARHAWLVQARESAGAGEPVEATVSELLAIWGATRREDSVVEAIEADLANYGLRTDPNFESVTPATLVRVVVVTPDDVREDHEPLHLIGRTVGTISSALGGITSVDPNASLDSAITTMLLEDFSQLAVLSGTRTLVGAVSWKSIAKAWHKGAKPTLLQATDKVQAISYATSLVDVLPLLVERDYVFVHNETNEIKGVVTSADVVRSYGELAEPFFLLGEVDRSLRPIVQQRFAIEDVLQICDKDGERAGLGFDRLTMGDLHTFLGDGDVWAKLKWPLEKRAFGKRLDQLREARNDITHYRSDPLPDDLVPHLKNFLALLRQYGA